MGNLFEILDELPSDLGLELFMEARQVRLAAGGDLDASVHLFVAPTSRTVGERRTEALGAAPADLQADLRTLMRVSRRTPPNSSEVALACEAVAEWAEDAGFPRTAVHLAEAGSAVAPKSARAAFVAARTNRAVGEAWRAEVYYLIAIRVAQRQFDWDSYIRANLGLGTLLADRRELEAATEHYFTAGWAALDQGIEWLAAQTYHDLGGIYFQRGDILKAQEFTERALEIYPRHNERFPVAVHDLALLWVTAGQFTDALPLLEALARAPLAPREQLRIAGLLARTAGSLDQRAVFEAAKDRVLRMAAQHESTAGAALIHLAYGARALKQWELAEETARAGIAAAERRKHEDVIALGRQFLSELAQRVPAHDPAPPLESSAARKRTLLMEKLMPRVSGWRVDSWTRKEAQAGTTTFGRV